MGHYSKQVVGIKDLELALRQITLLELPRVKAYCPTNDDLGLSSLSFVVQIRDPQSHMGPPPPQEKRRGALPANRILCSRVFPVATIMYEIN